MSRNPEELAMSHAFPLEKPVLFDVTELTHHVFYRFYELEKPVLFDVTEHEMSNMSKDC